VSFLTWLEATGLSVWVRETPSIWAFPFILFLHTLGLGIVAGLAVALDIWLLAFAARYPLAPFERLLPVIWIGFTINLVSGLLLLIAYPTKALTDPVFYLKIGMIVVALVLLERMRRRVFIDADASRPFAPDRALRVVAGVSIGLWAGAVLTGRLLAYTYNYLTASDLLWALGRGP
jgi:hypothetical protein